MKCKPAPDFGRFNLRLNPKREKHRHFIQILDSLPSGQKSEYVIDAVLAYGQEDERLASLLRKIIREELKDVSFASAKVQPIAPERSPEEPRTQRMKLDAESLKSFFNNL